MRVEQEVSTGRPLPQAFRVETVTDAAGFAALRTEWGALLERSRAGVFNGWEWLHPWYARLGEEAVLWILTARDGAGNLVGLMPLQLQTRRVLGRTVRRLSFLGEKQVGSDYLDVVTVRGLEDVVTRLFARTLRERQDEWDVLDLVDLDEASRTPELLRDELRGFAVGRTVRSICPYEPFEPGEKFEAFLKRTSRRDNYLRRRKWLEKQPGYRIEITTKPEELARPLSEFFRLHAMRWAEDGGSSGISSPEVEAFHRDTTWLHAEQGKLRLYTMWLGDKALASVYGIVDRDKFHYYQAGYDPEWRNKSVGLVLVGATFEDAIGLGVREYDFLRGTEPYKADWVSKTRQTIAVRAFVPGTRGAWLDAVEASAREVKDVVKRVVPEKTWERLRRLRH